MHKAVGSCLPACPSVHVQCRALLHATARMISGGPVYVSDKPGRHDPRLLSRLALPGGHLLQPLLPGRPCRDCLFADVCGDGVSALKVWNMNACGGVLALFNVQVRWGELRGASVLLGGQGVWLGVVSTGQGVLPCMLVCLLGHFALVPCWLCGQCVNVVCSSTCQLFAEHVCTHLPIHPHLTWVCCATHMQGSNWSRSRFDFVTHDRKPAAVTATVQPADVWLFSSCMQRAASSSAGGAAAPGHSSSSSSTGGIQLSHKLSFTGQYVLYTDRSSQLVVGQGLHQGCTLELRAAESEVVTVAPVIKLADACGSGSGSSVQCAVVGLVNMLNPGGAVLSVRASLQQQRLRTSDGSNNGGSGTDSGSWVLPVAPAAAHVPASESTAALSVHFVGCGELLLFASEAPGRVELDGEVVGFSYDASSRRLGVVVPVGDDASRDCSLLVHWH